MGVGMREHSAPTTAICRLSVCLPAHRGFYRAGTAIRVAASPVPESPKDELKPNVELSGGFLAFSVVTGVYRRPLQRFVMPGLMLYEFVTYSNGDFIRYGRSIGLDTDS